MSSRKKSIFGKPRLKGQLGSLFPKYDSWGLELDAMEVFLRECEAVSQKIPFTLGRVERLDIAKEILKGPSWLLGLCLAFTQ